jgi:hypothetical protein
LSGCSEWGDCNQAAQDQGTPKLHSNSRV